MSASSKQRISR